MNTTLDCIQIIHSHSNSFLVALGYPVIHIHSSTMFASPYTFLLSVAALVLPALVRADCECGYVVNSTLYTDLLETDFLHSSSVTTDWQAQKYSVQPQVSRGPYGKDAEVANVVPNPLKSKDDWSGNGTKGGEAGLQLIVRGGIPKDRLIPMAELVSTREDMLYGSFRTAMRMTGTNGTCGAFFWVCASPRWQVMCSPS